MSSERTVQFILRTHRPVLFLVALATIFSLAIVATRGLKADYRLEAFVATDDPSYDRLREFMEEFTSNEFALIAIHGEQPYDNRMRSVLESLSDRIRRIDVVQRSSSVADLPSILQRVRGDDLLAHPMLEGNLISADRRTVALLMQMSAEAAGGDVRRRTVAELRQIVADARTENPDLEIMLAGPYVTLIDMYDYVDRDLLVFSILAFVLIAVCLAIVFRRFPPMAYAAASALCAVFCTLGLTVAAGIVTSLITQMLVILIIVLAVANAVHLAVAAEETAHDHPDRPQRDQAATTLRRMTAPCAAVMLTTAAGFGSVCISQIAPVRRFGAMMVVGLAVALVVSLAAAVVLHSRGPAGPRTGRLANLLEGSARIAIRSRRSIIILFAVATAIIAWGASRLRFESDFVRNFRPGSEVRRSYNFIEENLSPLGSVEIVARRKDGGPAATAEAVRIADAIGHDAVSRHPLARKSLSLSDALTLLVPNPPTSDLDVQSRMTLLRTSPGGPSMLRNFINDDGDALRINLRCVEGFDVQKKLAACAEIEADAAARFGEDWSVEVTGLYHFYAKLVSGLLRDQYNALGITVGAIFMLLLIAFRSLRTALVAMVANLLPVIICLGAMGWASIPVNMTTAMMLSVTLGIAVDDTLHYMWRYRRELAACGDAAEAIHRVHAGVGRACFFTTVVITGGFTILILSRFLPTAYFGGLIGFTMLTALAADLLLLPALLMTLERRGHAASSEE